MSNFPLSLHPLMIDYFSISIDWSIALEPYGVRWRTWRKAFHENLHPAAAHKYRPLELKAARLFLKNLLETPQDFYEHVRQ